VISKTETKEKNWRDVVNKCNIATGSSSSSRLVGMRKEEININCLTPQEMREFIKKKIGGRGSINFNERSEVERTEIDNSNTK
jgi:hypothetical protein